MLIVSAVLAYPVLAGVYQSLFRAPELGLDEEWVGIDNYVRMFGDSDFWWSLYRTVLFVSHQLQAVRALCGRCILLDGGRVEADGETEDVLKAYYELVADKGVNATSGIGGRSRAARRPVVPDAV